MWQCSNCGEEVDDTFEVCWSCQFGKDGTRQAISQFGEHPQGTASAVGTLPARVCPHCGTKVDVDAKFCKNCAAPVVKAESISALNGVVPSNRKALIIGGIVLVALLVAGGITAMVLLTGAGPTKELAIQTLKALLSAHNRGDFEKAMSYLRNDEVEKDYRQAIRTGSTPRKVGISMEAIDALAEKGKLTTLTQYIDSHRSKIVNIPPDFPRMYGRKYNVPVESCHVLSMGGSGIAFYWDGKDMKLIASVDPHDKAGDFDK